MNTNKLTFVIIKCLVDYSSFLFANLILISENFLKKADIIILIKFK